MISFCIFCIGLIVAEVGQLTTYLARKHSDKAYSSKLEVCGEVTSLLGAVLMAFGMLGTLCPWLSDEVTSLMQQHVRWIIPGFVVAQVGKIAALVALRSKHKDYSSKLLNSGIASECCGIALMVLGLFICLALQ
jgi:hypothetical protein